MSYMDTLKQLKKKQISPIYLLYGTEYYFIQNLQDQIIKNILQEGDEENIIRYDLEEIPIQDVIIDAETYPFFGERKIIIASNPSFLKPKASKLSFEHDTKTLEKYIQNPAEYTVLVFVAPYEKIDERKKISKLLKKEGVAAYCAPIKDQEAAAWIKSLADQLHITIEKDVYGLLEEELSTDLNLLQNEITKLALHAGEGGTVTKQAAERLLSHNQNSSALRLVDAVLERNLQKAMLIYKDLEKMKEEPIALIALLAFQFRTILRVKILKNKGYSQSQMQKQLGSHPYVVKIAYKRAERFTLQGLEDIMDKLTEADTRMKQGKMEKNLAFELLLYDLIKRV